MDKSVLKPGAAFFNLIGFVTEEQGLFYFVYLMGGTVREKDIFSVCVDEFLGEIDNQRYLLYERRSWNKMQSYSVFQVSLQRPDKMQRPLHKP